MPSKFFIQSIEIGHHRYLSYEGKAEFGNGLNLLIGKNGSGKTTVLQMLMGLAEGAQDSLGDWQGTPPTNDVVNRITVERPEGPTSIEARISTGHWTNWEVLREKIRYVTSDRRLTASSTLPNVFATNAAFEPSRAPTDLNVAEEFTKAIIAELTDRLRAAGKAVETITEDIEQDYREALVEFTKDIRLDFDRGDLVFFLDHRGREVPLQNLSSGEKEYLYFYSYLRRIRNDENMVILIDEPELHLHSTQVAQICSMLSDLARKNQVIAATHSPEVLQRFLHDGKIVLLGEGTITNVAVSADMAAVVDDLGIPIDPSAFTAEWVTAENNPGRPLAGADAPTTEVFLGWLLGDSVRRKYWAFGSNQASGAAIDELLGRIAPQESDLRLSVILDGDRLCHDADSYPPDTEARATTLWYLPCWELENLILNPTVLDLLVSEDDDRINDILWKLVETNSDRLKRSVLKTVTKNAARRVRSDKLIDGGNPAEGLRRYKEQVAAVSVDESAIGDQFDRMIQNRNWQWLPGKEVLSLLLAKVPALWPQLRRLDSNQRTRALASGIEGSAVNELQTVEAKDRSRPIPNEGTCAQQ